MEKENLSRIQTSLLSFYQDKFWFSKKKKKLNNNFIKGKTAQIIHSTYQWLSSPIYTKSSVKLLSGNYVPSSSINTRISYLISKVNFQNATKSPWENCSQQISIITQENCHPYTILGTGNKHNSIWFTKLDLLHPWAFLQSGYCKTVQCLWEYGYPLG